jgi:DNA polymerase-4
MTTPADILNRRQAAGTFRTLSASVASRLRKHKLLGTCVQITVRDKDLYTFEHQRMLFEPTQSEKVIYETAMELFDESYDWHSAVRSVGVRCTKLIPEGSGIQMSLFPEEERNREEDTKLAKAIDDINRRFGDGTVRSCAEMDGIMSPNYDPEFYDGGITEGKRNPFQ